MAKHREVKFQAMSMINDDDDDEMPILPCAEKLELVLSTAPKKKTSDNTDKDSKNRKRSH